MYVCVGTFVADLTIEILNLMRLTSVMYALLSSTPLVTDYDTECITRNVLLKSVISFNKKNGKLS